MLLQLIDFIRIQKVVSMEQLVREFHIEKEALQPMLDIWIGRGQIRISEDKIACKSSCVRCDTKSVLLYIND